MKRLLAGRDAKSVASLLTMLRDNKPDSPYHSFMPRLVGSNAEVAALQSYLLTIEGQEGKTQVASGQPPSSVVTRALLARRR